MLDFVLDYFIKYLTKGVVAEKVTIDQLNKSPNIESATPDLDDDNVASIIKKKRDMIETMSELMQLLQPDSNIRQFDDAKFIEAIIQIITFTSVNQECLTGKVDFDRQFRICVEIYMSKICTIDKLLEILDKTMSVI